MSDDDNAKIRDVLIRARSALHTCLRDTDETLKAPSRRKAIERRIDECTEIIEMVEKEVKVEEP